MQCATVAEALTVSTSGGVTYRGAAAATFLHFIFLYFVHMKPSGCTFVT